MAVRCLRGRRLCRRDAETHARRPQYAGRGSRQAYRRTAGLEILPRRREVRLVLARKPNWPTATPGTATPRTATGKFGANVAGLAALSASPDTQPTTPPGLHVVQRSIEDLPQIGGLGQPLCVAASRCGSIRARCAPRTLVAQRLPRRPCRNLATSVHIGRFAVWSARSSTHERRKQLNSISATLAWTDEAYAIGLVVRRARSCLASVFRDQSLRGSW